jgi:hypothetical protein
VAPSSDEHRDALLGLMEEAARTQEHVRSYTEELKRWGQVRRPIDPTDTDAGWLVLATSSDDHLSWLRAGEAMQAMWLWASSHGLAFVPHSQVVEVPSTLRRLQETFFDDTACPQLVVRLGWPPMLADTDMRTPAGVTSTSADTDDQGA